MMKLSSRVVTVSRTPIFMGQGVYEAIDHLLRRLRPGSVFILTDPNTRRHCLPLLTERCTSIAGAQILETGTGESAKSLANAEQLWMSLLGSGAGRSSLLINLGGGVVSDLGGFTAAGYKRGIRYINIPTSLMGQADAAIGGKTAVNLGNIKNQVGFFYPPEAVFIIPGFLKTLPEEHLRSGLAEIIKSVLISDDAGWRRLTRLSVNDILHVPVGSEVWANLIEGAVKFKNKVVSRDHHEQKLRKILNFGHTIGHALEALSHNKPAEPLLHGEAVAAGMICSAYLSKLKTGLDQADLEAIRAYLAAGFTFFPVEDVERSEILDLMTHDKKNRNGQFQFTLLAKPGCPVINRTCTREEVSEALDFYNSGYRNQ